MVNLSEFELLVHNCTKCKELSFGHVIQYYPVLSFGDPKNKTFLVVGLNPSIYEYQKDFLSDSKDPVRRHQSQIDYFFKREKVSDNVYTFFKNLAKFFNGDAKKALKWNESPWEKVGFIDLVKCPTSTNGGQWTSIKPKSRRMNIIRKCEKYLEKQLEILNPNIVMAYGADVCRWFLPEYKEENNAYTIVNVDKNNQTMTILFVPQTRGSHPERIISIVQGKIARIIRSIE